MRYTTAIYDRKYSDVYYKTSKGYFNVSDWLRIYENTRNLDTLYGALQGSSIGFVGLPNIAEPLITSFPSVSSFNALLNCIEQIRLDAVGLTPNVSINALTTVIKHDWQAGWDKDAPKYTDVNLWEKTIEIIYLNIADAVGYTPVPPTGSPVRRARCGVAQTGIGLTRNNGFSQYA